jgi:hypothetical protein
MEIYLDGQKLGLYVNRTSQKGQFSSRFCPLKDSLDDSVPHTLRLVPVSVPDAVHPSIMLRALLIDADNL